MKFQLDVKTPASAFSKMGNNVSEYVFDFTFNDKASEKMVYIYINESVKSQSIQIYEGKLRQT